jgi:hypothetical protein
MDLARVLQRNQGEGRAAGISKKSNSAIRSARPP